MRRTAASLLAAASLVAGAALAPLPNALEDEDKLEMLNAGLLEEALDDFYRNYAKKQGVIAPPARSSGWATSGCSKRTSTPAPSTSTS